MEGRESQSRFHGILLGVLAKLDANMQGGWVCKRLQTVLLDEWGITNITFNSFHDGLWRSDLACVVIKLKLTRTDVD